MNEVFALFILLHVYNIPHTSNKFLAHSYPDIIMNLKPHNFFSITLPYSSALMDFQYQASAIMDFITPSVYLNNIRI